MGLRTEERPRGIGARTLPRPPTEAPPTPEEAKAANSGAYKGSTRTVERVGGNKLLKIAAAGGILGAGAYAAYETIPAVHERINSFLNSFTDKRLVPIAETNTVNPNEVFDNTKTKGTISLENILYVPREVFDKTPLTDAEGNPIFDFPWDSNNPVKIKYEKSLYPRPDWWQRSGADIDPNTEIKNSFEGIVTLPAGYEFTTSYPGRVFFAGSGAYDEEASRKSPSNPYGLAVYKEGPITGAKIEFIAPNGVLYFINIGFRNDKGNVILEPLIDVVFTALDNSYAKNWEKGTLVERGQKIFRLKQEGRLGMYIQGGKNGSLGDQARVPGNFVFQTGKDSNGVEKLLVAEGK